MLCYCLCDFLFSPLGGTPPPSGMVLLQELISLNRIDFPNLFIGSKHIYPRNTAVIVVDRTK
jgi:hypothetical protein